MANSVINENIFTPTAEGQYKFVDLKGLDHFWSKAQKYIDDADGLLSGRIAALEGTVGDNTKGLVKDVKSIQDELNSLSGGAGSIATQIDNAIAALDLPNTYEAKGAAATALGEAKVYVDGKVDGKFDAAGSAAAAEAAAKSYADGKVADAVGVYASEGVEASGLRKEIAERDAAVLAEAKGYADTKDAAMSERVAVLEAIDHNQLAADASAAAVATILDGAPEAFDTLKEVAQWIADSESAADAADLVTRVGALESGKADKSYVDSLNTTMSGRVDALEAIDHDAYVAADAALATTLRGEIATAKSEAIADAKAYVDGKVDGKFDAVGSAAAALGEAKSYADGVAATAKTEAIDAAASAVDTKLAGYTNTTDMTAAIEAAKAAAIADAKGKIDALTATVNLKADKSYVDEQVTGAKAYASTYTDALFNSITFASAGEIDSIF